MLKIYDQYLLRQLLLTAFIIAGGLSMIIMLTQSLRLFELVLESNASASAFLTLMGLTLPRFLEAVLPASALIATLFVFNRLGQDSEMVVMRASGASPMRLARPVIAASLILSLFLLILSLWLSPIGISNMQHLRKEIRSQYAHLLFREGIFNTVGNNLTAYIRARAPDGRLEGLVVHDTRHQKSNGIATTVIARSGHIIDDDDIQKIIVYDGSRQEKNTHTGTFSKLDFQQYMLEIPASTNHMGDRWREPDERTIGELLDFNSIALENERNQKQFRAELHRRISNPFLILSFTLIAATALLLGNFTRAGALPSIILGATLAIGAQALYLLSYNIAKVNAAGCIALYITAILPALLSLFFLTHSGETMLTKLGLAWRNMRHSQ